MRPLKKVLLGLAFALPAHVAAHAEPLPKAEYSCNFGNPDPQDKSGESAVYRCRPVAGDNAPPFAVAVLKGTPAEVNRAHGYLLAREAEMGPMSEAVDLVKFGLAQQSFLLRPSLENVVSCFSNNLYKSLNPEFQANLAAFEEGYRQRLGAAAQYPEPQMRLAATGIELDNIMTAVGYRHGTIGSMLAAEKNCPGDLLLKVILNGGLKLVGKDKGLGCTAFAIPGRTRNGTMLSREGLLFGRTLDAELMRSWNRVPALFIVHEQGQDDRGRPYLSYVATGAAGLIYAGGISGYNTAGITVSLHQMYASDAVLRVPASEPRKAALAPVLTQIILREARSIEDAVRIANRYQAIATWTILIADAKTGKAGAIEISKGGVKLVRQTQNRPIAQTNHVFDPKQQAYAFFPSYNKYNETRTRMAVLEKAFGRLQRQAAQGHPFDAAQAITQLANHEDINGRFQPFGTTSVKAYDVMSAVMLPQAHKIYMSVGDFAPSPHATFLGFQLDEKLDPVALTGTLRDQTLAGTPGVLQSLQDYVQARLAYESKDYAEAERLIRQAIAHASDESSNGADPAWSERKAGALRIYNYILARLLAMKATHELDPRRSIFTRLLTIKAKQKDDGAAAYTESRALFETVIKDPAVLPYQRALAEYYYGLTELKFRKRGLMPAKLSPETAAFVKDAVRIFQDKLEIDAGSKIQDLADNVSNARKVLEGRVDRSLKAGDIDWIVIR
jgi:Acyl-coenzyme A:6-aminopenicillanic acid acyl-transferase